MSEERTADNDALAEVERRVLAEIESARNDAAEVTVCALYIALRIVREVRDAQPVAPEEPV